MWELELWASVTPIFVFFFSVGCWLSKPMWYTFELIPHWFEGSVLVLCYQSLLPVCVTSVLQDGILEQLHLCQLGSNVPNEKGTKESANDSSFPWKLVYRIIIQLMCCYTLNSVFHDGWNPFQCSLPFRTVTWPQISLSDPKWLGNAAALTAEFRHCRIHGDRMSATTTLVEYVREC